MADTPDRELVKRLRTYAPGPELGRVHVETELARTIKEAIATIARQAEELREAREIIQGFRECPEIADYAPVDKDPDTDAIERRARAFLSRTKEGSDG